MDLVVSKGNSKYYLLLLLFFIGLFWSGINPRRYDHWIGESLPPVVGLIILVLTFKKFRFTMVTYSVILLSCWFMFVGAHYTFSRVPIFDWIKEILGTERNDFDKFGHVFQGIIPILLTRELFIRKKIIAGSGWISFISFCICMATTSVYEIIEYMVCSIAGKNPTTFLGTQGDIWDSQSDMLAAAIGGLFMLLFLRKLHDRIIEKEFPGTFLKYNNPKSKTDSAAR
jgi:putative membrane protein